MVYNCSHEVMASGLHGFSARKGMCGCPSADVSVGGADGVN